MCIGCKHKLFFRYKIKCDTKTKTRRIPVPVVWYGFFIHYYMKKQTQKGVKETVRHNTPKQRPEIRDNLDSRVNEEQDFKGDDVTHNKKEHRKPEKKDPNS